MDTEKATKALNNLIEINNDRIEGYETAAKETDSVELKGLFSAWRDTSENIVSELRSEVVALGGTPEEGTRVTGKFFRAWMDVKAALTGNDRHQILSSCEFGEDKAQETYEDVLETYANDLTSQQISMIQDQKAKLRVDHDKVKALRDAEA
ncbi:MAG: PA2169 family four-helix-bundle protein [Flavobacterium sp.]|nr:MAG: PA2169 family four-helix-bundle protein [Flavobacterium sp.]